MSQIGYGDPQGVGGGYGNNIYGYGHPYLVQTTWIEPGTDGNRRHDLGGELITARTSGQFPPGPFVAKLGGKLCYSGVAGQGSNISPAADRKSFRCVTPHQLGITGAVDLQIIGSFGTIVYTGVVLVVPHSGEAQTVGLALRWPRDVWYLPIFGPRA